MDRTLAGLTPAQRVSLLGLRLRALDARSATPILDDTASLRAAQDMGLDLSSPKIPRSVVAVHAVRAKTLDNIVRRFVAEHPDAVVVDLGCGLDPRMHRCAPAPSVDWYDVDFPAVTRLRERFLPAGAHPVGVKIGSPGWLDTLPRGRPSVIVTDGLTALLNATALTEMVRAVTAHFPSGELAFNAYSRLAMRNSRRLRRGPLAMPTEGDGIDDPREPETWGARLLLIEELSIGRAPEVALFPPLLRAVTRVSARGTRMVRIGDRVLRFTFPA